MQQKDPILRELEAVKAEQLAQKYKTALQKAQFIQQLQGGLADEIKANPNTFKIIRKTPLQRLGILLRKFFTKF